jgi:hypothetical protein
MNDALYLLISPCITFAVEAAKRAGLPSEFAFILALLLGTIYGITFAVIEKNPENLFKGILAGAAAIGFYETGKHGIEAAKLLKNK